MRNIRGEEKTVIQDFEYWVGKMEEKHKTASANIYNHIRHYLNRMDRQIKRNVKNVMSESFLEVSENFEKKR